jgi:hypothetical protein
MTNIKSVRLKPQSKLKQTLKGNLLPVGFVSNYMNYNLHSIIRHANGSKIIMISAIEKGNRPVIEDIIWESHLYMRGKIPAQQMSCFVLPAG